MSDKGRKRSTAGEEAQEAPGGEDVIPSDDAYQDAVWDVFQEAPEGDGRQGGGWGDESQAVPFEASQIRGRGGTSEPVGRVIGAGRAA